MTTYTFKRITADRYDDMLGVLPPAVHRHNGFLLGEEWTHIDGIPHYRAFFCLSDDCFVECEQPVSRFAFDRILTPAFVARALAAQEAALNAKLAPARWWEREEIAHDGDEVWRENAQTLSITFLKPAARHDNLLCVVVNGRMHNTTHSILKVY